MKIEFPVNKWPCPSRDRAFSEILSGTRNHKNVSKLPGKIWFGHQTRIWLENFLKTHPDMIPPDWELLGDGKFHQKVSQEPQNQNLDA
jgi:hypothetical protein